MRHINIPIFIPHMGCPNTCVFCDQRSISGRESFDIALVEREIESVLSTVSDGDEVEIAFFGGSFTGIDRELMVTLLTRAQAYVSQGRVDGIRLSTRPDYIDDEVLAILSAFSVKTIELGLQSMDDRVLSASRRGHTAEQGRLACHRIKERGFSLVGQMMIGLPEGDLENEVQTARTLCELSVDGVRVYPTVVFRETELCRMAERGKYRPLDLEDAVLRTKEVLKIFDQNDIPCLRVGLAASENLSSQRVFGGADHSAIGELAMGEIFYENMCRAIEAEGGVAGRIVTFFVPRGATSRAIGQKRKNIERIYKKYLPLRIKVLEKNDIMRYNTIMTLS